MKRRSEGWSLRKWIASAVVAATLVVGVSGPVYTIPDQDDAPAAPTVYEFGGGIPGGVQLLGGSWS